MAEYRYTIADRQVQLDRLAAALQELVPVLAALPEFAAAVPIYEAAQQQAEHLRREGFTQDQLTALARSVPDLFYRHKDWSPPAEPTAAGGWQEPAWFTRLEARLQPALAAAAILESVGYY